MDQRKIECIHSAFRHGFTGEDIRWALNNHLADGVAEEGDETARVAVGFDRSVKEALIYSRLEGGAQDPPVK